MPARQPAWAHPYFRAAFVLLGDPENHSLDATLMAHRREARGDGR
jgi:hypothetical protein